jgi:hypothetical protein|uniref:Uncharacterized protein n=1 Tax=Eutreptiella gymnastica TaxID=73025 RepID=A0A7S4LF92_9EUGL
MQKTVVTNTAGKCKAEPFQTFPSIPRHPKGRWRKYVSQWPSPKSKQGPSICFMDLQPLHKADTGPKPATPWSMAQSGKAAAVLEMVSGVTLGQPALCTKSTPDNDEPD